MEDDPEIDPLTTRTLFSHTRGKNSKTWFTFKRFEGLCLLNLYHVQHELIELEENISTSGGLMTRNDNRNLRDLLNDYRKHHLPTI